MNIEIALRLLSAVVSLAGLRTRDSARKLALYLLALMSLALLLIGVMHQCEVRKVEDQILVTIGTSSMTADQLYENVYSTNIPRPTFDAALNHAVETRRLVHKMVDIRTPDLELRVRIYSAR